MGRREQRENIFQLLFMTEFNDGEAMNEQQRQKNSEEMIPLPLSMECLQDW